MNRDGLLPRGADVAARHADNVADVVVATCQSPLTYSNTRSIKGMLWGF